MVRSRWWCGGRKEVCHDGERTAHSGEQSSVRERMREREKRAGRLLTTAQSSGGGGGRRWRGHAADRWRGASGVFQ